MGITDILTSNSKLSIIWLLSNTKNNDTNNNVYTTSANNMNSNNASLSPHKFSKSLKKKDIVNLSIHDFLNDSSVVDQVVHELNLRHQSKIMYGLTLCYNRQIGFILDDLLKTKSQLFKELEKKRPTNKIATDKVTGKDTATTSIFDGFREYKTLFELQKSQVQNNCLLRNGNIVDFQIFGGTAAAHNNKTMVGFLNNDANFPIFGNDFLTNSVDYDLIQKIMAPDHNDAITKIAHGKEEKKEKEKETNKLAIKQYDLSKELNLFTSFDKNSMHAETGYFDKINEENISTSEETDYELNLLSDTSHIYMDFDNLGKKRSRSDSMVSLNSDFKIDLIDLNSDAKRHYDHKNNDLSFDLFESNNENNAFQEASDMEASDLEDGNNFSNATSLSSSPSKTLVKGLAFVNTNSNAAAANRFKKIRVDEKIILSNTDLRDNSENYLNNMKEFQARKSKADNDFAKRRVLNKNDFFIGNSLNMLDLLALADVDRTAMLEIGRNETGNDVNENEHHHRRNIELGHDVDSDTNDAGSVVSSVERGRRDLYEDGMNDIYLIDEDYYEGEDESDIMNMDLNLGTTASSSSSSAANWRTGKNSFAGTSSDPVHTGVIDEDRGQCEESHPIGVRQNDHRNSRLYCSLVDELEKTGESTLSLNQLISCRKDKRHGTRQTVCAVFYSLLQLATRDMLTVTNDSSSAHGLRLLHGDDILVSLNQK